MSFEGPFVEGRSLKGRVLYPGYEHVNCDFQIVSIQPEHYFAYRWHPYAVEPGVDYSGEPTTLVEFRLEGRGAETALTVVESGFDRIPAHRRAEAYRMNEGGWTAQVANITEYLARA
ncbi:MAG: SRPBCC family protein [Vicinamibacterales bacterium]